MDAFSSNAANTQMTLCKILKVAKWKELKEAESGYIFTTEHLASNWDNICVQPESLPKGEAQRGMRKVTSPVLLLKSHSPKMAFILATENSPVYVCSSFKRDKYDGYTMLFNTMPQVYPEYFFYLSKYKTWINISYDLDSNDMYGLESGFKEVGNCFFDGVREFITYAESVFLNDSLAKLFLIPSKPVQEQQMEDAKKMEQHILAKMSEKERKFQQKEWLNETHIHNCKHRLSNDIMPISMGVELLRQIISDSPDGVKTSSIIDIDSQQTIGGLLNNLKSLIDRIESDIEDLAKSEKEQPETLDVEPFIKDYCETVVSKYNHRFLIDVQAKDADLKIKISRKSFEELLDCVIDNAFKHGFTDDSRNDYKILIMLSESSERYCRIDIANNGNPISERGRKEYFVRGSFAGETGHSGIGGARVYEICENFNGKAIEPYTIEGFPVVISVEFPIVSF